MLDAATQRMMQQTLSSQFMPETIQIYNVTSSTNAYGESVYTRTLALTVKGQHQELNGSERKLVAAIIDTGLENIETLKLILPYGTSVTVSQDIKTADNKYWHITHVTTNKTYNAAVEVLLTRKTISSGI